MRPRLRLWHVAAIAAAAFIVLRILLPQLGQLPRTLTAAESDALLGAQRLSAQLAPAEAGAPPREPLMRRLRAGFETHPSHPRLAVLRPERSAERAVLEAPLPRWLGALGIGVLPTSASATNLERAATASALAVALALALLVWGLRRHPWLVAVVALGALLGTPGVIDAALSAGHGAAAVLLSVAFLLALEHAARHRAGLGPTLGPTLGIGALVGLLAGVHPGALVLYPVVLVVWAIHTPPRRDPAHAPSPPPSGMLALPVAPLALLALPVVALAVLVASWPALWDETGKRLAAWFLDYGSQPSAPHEVLGMTFDQASGRSAQAFTAILQWVAWTPLPILAAWLVGVARALRLGRDGAWAPIVTWLGWLAVGSLDGGLFGGRNSLLVLLWVPTAITAAHGARSILELVDAQLTRRRGRLARWLAARTATARALGVAAVLLLVPLLQSARGTTLGLARQTGSELREPLPLALVTALARTHPWAVVHAAPRHEALLPALEAAREGMSLDLMTGSIDEADILVVSVATGSPPPPELQARLAAGRETMRDARPGLVVGVWEVGDPRRLDKPPALPHN